MTPRIIAGTWRGRALATPPGEATRPTAARVRQALFDMLRHAPWAEQSLIEGAAVLDVFAGSGALGLEALSRGAARASFIERDAAAAAAIARNISACRAGERAALFRADALRPPQGPPHSLILLDPPYGENLIRPAILALRKAGWIAPDGIVAAEFGRDEPVPAMIALLAERAHGAARIVIGKIAE